MLANIEDSSDFEKRLSFYVDKNSVDFTADAVARQLLPRAEVKGFRVGKAPLALVKINFDKVIKRETATKLVQEEISGAFKLRDLKLFGIPRIAEDFEPTQEKRHHGKFLEDGRFAFDVHVDCLPEIDVIIPELTISEPLPSLDEYVESDLAKNAELLASKELVERASVLGDELLLEDADGTTVTVMATEHNAIGAEVDNLLGKSVGDTIVVGDATFKVESVLEVSSVKIDDGLAHAMQHDSLDEMRAALAKKIKDTVLPPLRAKLYEQVLTQLIEANPTNFPERWTDTEMANVMRRLGVKDLSALSEDIVTHLKNVAAKSLLSNLLLDGIYRATESIHITPDEAYTILDEEATRQNLETDGLITRLREAGHYDTFMAFHERNRVIDYLIAKARCNQGDSI